MINKLKTKLGGDTAYNREEIKWLLDHIGDPNPAIRDELVYASFCHGLLNQHISLDDFAYLLDKTRQTNTLFHQIGTKSDSSLTRSFTALLYALLLDADQTPTLIYHRALTHEARLWLFQAALTYLDQEKDSRGYDKEKGWIHCSAHAAEFLLNASNHDLFPDTDLTRILPSLVQHLNQQTEIFSAGEERRLALVLTNLIIKGRLSTDQLLHDLGNYDWPDQTPNDYFAKINLDNFLSCVYFQLKAHDKLDSNLQIALEKHLAQSL